MKIALLQKRKPATGLRKLYSKYLVKTSRRSSNTAFSKMYTSSKVSVSEFVTETGKMIQVRSRKIKKSILIKPFVKGTVISIQAKAITKWYNKKAVPAFAKADKKLNNIEKQIGNGLANIGKSIKVAIPVMRKNIVSNYNKVNKMISKKGPQIKALLGTNGKNRQYIWS